MPLAAAVDGRFARLARGASGQTVGGPARQRTGVVAGTDCIRRTCGATAPVLPDGRRRGACSRGVGGCGRDGVALSWLGGGGNLTTSQCDLSRCPSRRSRAANLRAGSRPMAASSCSSGMASSRIIRTSTSRWSAQARPCGSRRIPRRRQTRAGRRTAGTSHFSDGRSPAKCR